jgi:hypothetical protein
MSRTPPRYAFVFVCQAGELEIKALLLAASLKRFLRCDFELIAALPTPASTWGELAPETRGLLQQLGVRIEPIVNPIDPDYKIGNKLACFDVPTRADRVVFLDSDILCLRDLGEPDCLRVPFAAKPADLRTFAAGAEAWQPLYAAAGVDLPQLRLPTTVSGEFGLAYFNSGVIFADSACGIGKAWIDCARTILQVPAMREQRHWLDQVSLAIAVHKLGLAYSGLDERFNFPAHLKPVPDELPFFCHYHWPHIIGREPLLMDLVRDLAGEYPVIAGRMADNAQWKALLKASPPRSASRPSAERLAPTVTTLLIAGIPGSGADELLELLRPHERCTIHDEPAELAAALVARAPPWEVAAYLRDAKRDHRDTDIAVIRSTLPFLCRIDALKRVLPDAQLVLCVRNPFDTIAQWKARPPGEVDAAIGWAAGSADHWATANDVAALRRIVDLSDAAEKRAAWWWWLAQRALGHAHGVQVVRYGDVIGDSSDVLGTILPGTPVNGPHGRAQIAPSGQTAALDERDLQAIRAICLQAAAELGVSERGS